MGRAYYCMFADILHMSLILLWMLFYFTQTDLHALALAALINCPYVQGNFKVLGFQSVTLEKCLPIAQLFPFYIPEEVSFTKCLNEYLW